MIWINLQVDKNGAWNNFVRPKFIMGNLLFHNGIKIFITNYQIMTIMKIKRILIRSLIII